MPTPITRHYWHFSLRRNLLAQYLWRDYLKGIAVGCAVLLAIFLLAQVIIVLPIVIQSGFQWSVLLRIIVFYIPQALVIIFPLVLSIGVFIIMRKQLDNHELLIARGFGVSERQLLQIINALAMLGFVILLLLKGYLTPWSQKAYRDVQLRASQNIVRAFLEEGRFFSPAPGFTIFIGKKNLGGLLEDIFIMDRRQTNTASTIVAQKGLVSGDNTLILNHGTQFHIGGPRTTSLEFDRYSMDISIFQPQSRASGFTEEDLTFLWHHWYNTPWEKLVDERYALLLLLERLTYCFFGLSLPLIAAQILWRSPIDKSGRYTPQAVLVFTITIAALIFHLFAYNVARNHVDQWWFMLVPSLTFFAILALVSIWPHPLHRRRP